MVWPGISEKEGNPHESSGFPLAICGLRGASSYITQLPAATMSSLYAKFSSWNASLCDTVEGQLLPGSCRGAFLSIASPGDFAYNRGTELPVACMYRTALLHCIEPSVRCVLPCRLTCSFSSQGSVSCWIWFSRMVVLTISWVTWLFKLSHLKI
jgi:hypothetical protein